MRHDITREIQHGKQNTKIIHAEKYNTKNIAQKFHTRKTIPHAHRTPQVDKGLRNRCKLLVNHGHRE